ncbi:hypothetical protein PybrP1_004188 [[Pythium] brassicae (nom. inval.)]|nr:hypothetical protein PybrP1_004188 [[Pythium] brassicae (nom. inval.)]
MSLFSMDDSSVWGKGSSLFNISSPLNDLLEKDDFTLEQVLEEDELIQEVKTRNTKLLEFLAREKSVLQMIEYVVRAPEDPSDDLRALKYPYMACEVLCCDIMSITETLATASEGKIVETMFEFLYQPEPLDSRLAGYFEKIMSMLMVRKPQEMTALMNKHSERLLQGFVAHADAFSVAELLKRLLQPYHSDYMDEMDFPGMAVGFPPSNAWYGGGHDDDDISVGTPTSALHKSLAWQHEPLVVDLLLANLAPGTAADASDASPVGSVVDSDVHKHSAEILVDIIHCGTRAQQNDPASPTSSNSPVSFALLEYLETPEVVEKIVALAVPTACFSASSMTSALSVLSALLSRHTNARYSSSDEMPAAVTSTVARIPQICATLRGEDHEAGTLRNQRRQETQRLGLRRLKLVGLLVLLMQSKYHKVDAALLQENAIDTCLDLFFTFESNNMLHADVESMVVGILENGGPDLLTGLIKSGRLLERILEAHDKNDAATAAAKGNSLGYMGHLHRICNMMMSLAEDARGSTADGRSLNDMTHADSVLEMLEEDKALWTKWEDLSSKVLAPLYERERLPLGGVSISSGNEDPYMGFNQSDELLNAQFAEMLGASGFQSGSSDFDNYFDLKNNDTPMLPEIMNDSSSSEDEDDDDVRYGHNRDSDDGFAFDPRGVAAAFPTTTTASSANDATEIDATDRWANFEASASWATFDDSSASAGFEVPFDTTPMDESEMSGESATAAVMATATVAETLTETTTTATTTTTTESVDISSVQVSVEGEAAATAATATINEGRAGDDELSTARCPRRQLTTLQDAAAHLRLQLRLGLRSLRRLDDDLLRGLSDDDGDLESLLLFRLAFLPARALERRPLSSD